MRPIIQELSNKLAGTDVFIVGGGNSLRGFDFSKLKGKNVIAVNSAFKYVDETAVLYWLDATWPKTKGAVGLAEHPSKLKFTGRASCDGAIRTNKIGEYGEHYLRKTGNSGLDPNPDNVRGNNSGANAINLAVNMSASRILLLGFDMGHVKGKANFHDDHEQQASFLDYVEVFIPCIDSMAKEIKNYPVEVINCNRDSNLKCFKFGDVEDYL